MQVMEGSLINSFNRLTKMTVKAFYMELLLRDYKKTMTNSEPNKFITFVVVFFELLLFVL